MACTVVGSHPSPVEVAELPVMQFVSQAKATGKLFRLFPGNKKAALIVVYGITEAFKIELVLFKTKIEVTSYKMYNLNKTLETKMERRKVEEE